MLAPKSGVNHSKISAIADVQSLAVVGRLGVNHSKISTIADVTLHSFLSMCGVNHCKICYRKHTGSMHKSAVRF